MTDYRALIPYAVTERQKEVLEALDRHGSQRAAADALGVWRNAVVESYKQVKRRAARQGYSPEHDFNKPVPDGFKAKGISTLYDEEGKPRAQWVKAHEDRERQQEIMQQAVEAMADDLPKIKPHPAPSEHFESLLTVIPMGDPHFGMYAWAEEAGDDWDLDLAKELHCSAVDYLVKQAPPSARCAIISLGDLFHADNLEGVTTRSGHVLDMDTRLPKVIQVGVSAMRQCIESALEHHQTVEVICAQGNHDDVLSMAMAIMLSNVYENEPRVTVYDQPTRRHYLQHGNVLIGVTHGDKTRDRDLPGIMATEKPQEWGQTQYRYYYRGHHHHDERVEYNGCIVEQFRTLAAADAYASGSGYLAGRDMKAIVHHAEHGEVQRITCSLGMLR